MGLAPLPDMGVLLNITLPVRPIATPTTPVSRLYREWLGALHVNALLREWQDSPLPSGLFGASCHPLHRRIFYSQAA
jgi:hypothetical protein